MRTIDARREGDTKRDMPELKNARHTYWQYLTINDAWAFGRTVIIYRKGVPLLGTVHLHHFQYNYAETDGVLREALTPTAQNWKRIQNE